MSKSPASPYLTASSLARILAGTPKDAPVLIPTRNDVGEFIFAPARLTRSVTYGVKEQRVGLARLTKQAIALGFTQGDVVTKGKPAIALTA